MQAILVKYLPATNVKPARLKARALAGSVTIMYHSVPIDYSGTTDLYAAIKLCEKLGWTTEDLVEGTLPDGDSVFVKLK